jgi:hypothetical protein
LGDRGRTTSATAAKAGLTRALAGWVSEQLPGFPFTSIHVNVDSQAGIHIDEANTGMAAVWAGGEFRGGRLLVIPPDFQPFAVPVEQQWAFLNPFTAHAVKGWVGHRISLVAYWRDASSLPGYEKRFLRSLGFQLEAAGDRAFMALPGACPSKAAGLQHVAACRYTPAHVWAQAADQMRTGK